MRRNNVLLNEDKTKDQLLDELKSIRKRVARLEEIASSKNKELEALKKSEEQFRLIAENIRDNVAISTFDLKAKYLYVSPSVKSTLDYEPEDLIGKSFFTFIHPDDKKKLLPLLKKYLSLKIKKLLTGKGSTISETVEYRFKNKHGNWHYLQTSINIIGKRLLSVSRDITKQKEVDRKLQESESHYRQLFNLLPYGGELIDLNGNILDCSLSTARMLGYDRGQLIGSHITSYIDLATIREYKNNFPKLLKGECVSVEAQMVHKNGKKINIYRAAEPIFNSDGEIEAILALSMDITQRKKVEEKLKQSERDYRELFDNSSDAIYIQDQKGLFLDVNQGVVEMYGYPKEYFIGKTPEFLSAPEKNDMEKVFGFIKETFTGKPQQFDFWGIRKNGEIFPKIVRTKLGFYMGKMVIITFAMDITDRYNTEKEKAVLKEQLQHAQKMEAIGTLAGGIAHDFNNILGAIIGYTDLTLKNPDDGKRVTKYMQNVMNASIRAKDMVKQILSFSRKNKSSLSEVYISGIIAETIKFLKSSLPTTIDIKTDIETDVEPILADPTQINQILMNLCTNAAHAMKESGGIIKIYLKNIEIETYNSLSGLKPGKYQLLKVQDSGIGIKKNVLSKIFEPYFTTKDIGEGTGMGLAVVYGIVKAYGGDIKVKSTLGKVAVFDVYLPVMKNYNLGIINKKEDYSFDDECDETILFVDDESYITNMNYDLLTDLGYKVDSVTDSINALEMFKHDPGKYDLLITDMTMPNMTGSKLTAEVHKLRPDLPVIVCTGFSDNINEDNFRSMGISALLMKPVDAKEYLDTIRNVLKNNSQ